MLAAKPHQTKRPQRAVLAVVVDKQASKCPTMPRGAPTSAGTSRHAVSQTLLKVPMDKMRRSARPKASSEAPRLRTGALSAMLW